MMSLTSKPADRPVSSKSSKRAGPAAIARYREVDRKKRRAERARQTPTRGPRALIKPAPVIGNTCRVGVCLSPAELERVDAEAERLAMNRSAFLRAAAEHWIRSREQNEGAHVR